MDRISPYDKDSCDFGWNHEQFYVYVMRADNEKYPSVVHKNGTIPIVFPHNLTSGGAAPPVLCAYGDFLGGVSIYLFFPLFVYLVSIKLFYI